MRQKELKRQKRTQTTIQTIKLLMPKMSLIRILIVRKMTRSIRPNNYTDSKISDTKTELNANIDKAKNDAISSSNSYTDNKISDTKTELNASIDKAKNDAISSSNSYTDNKISDTKTELNASIDKAKNDAIS